MHITNTAGSEGVKRRHVSRTKTVYHQPLAAQGAERDDRLEQHPKGAPRSPHQLARRRTAPTHPSKLALAKAARVLTQPNTKNDYD